MTPYYTEPGIEIYHGDCREVLPELGKVDLVLTDPPYGADVKYGEAYSDDRSVYWEWFLPCLEYIIGAVATTVFTHRNAALLHVKGYDWVGVWDKGGAGGARMGNSCIVAGWEPVFMFGIHSYGTRSQGFPDVFRIRPEVGLANVSGIGREKWKIGSTCYHPTPKPLALYHQFIRVFGQGKDLILDPFMGSGTTLRAAKDLGRTAIGIEIEEKYCEIAVKRLRQEVLAI